MFYNWAMIGRRFWAVGLAAASLLSASFAARGQFSELTPLPPEVRAESFILVDFETGEVIAEKNADRRFAPASLTKLMTAYLAFSALREGRISADFPAAISRKARRMGGSRMFVEAGERVTVMDLLRGVIVQSGNDASVALAEALAGDERAFVDLMNQQAAVFGLQNTRFADSAGLGGEDHYSSARDVAEMARRTIADFPRLYKLYAEREFAYNGILQPNRNGLLDSYPGADGLKTGYTKSAGYCLAASAQRCDGGCRRLISVVMKAPSARARETASEKLLNYGFANFEVVHLFDAGQKVRDLRVWRGEKNQVAAGVGAEQKILVARGLGAKLKAQLAAAPPLEAPIAEGMQVGEVHISAGGEVLRKIPLFAQESVGEGGVFKRAADYLRRDILGRE